MRFPIIEAINSVFICLLELEVKLNFRHPASYSLWYEVVKPRYQQLGILHKSLSMKAELEYVKQHDFDGKGKRDYIIGCIKGYLLIAALFTMVIIIAIAKYSK